MKEKPYIYVVSTYMMVHLFICHSLIMGDEVHPKCKTLNSSIVLP